MRIYLVRHGQAVSSDVDPNQPLTKEAMNKLSLFGAVLKKYDLNVDEIIHSEKLRARQTAEILAQAFAPGVVIEERPGLKPNDSPDTILNEIDSNDRDLMLVGHLPFLESLMSRLLNAQNAQIFDFKAGSIVCLEKENGKWLISWALYPEMII